MPTIGEEIPQYSEPFEDIPADRHALVAAGTAVALEHRVALLRLRRDGLCLAAQVAVEWRIRGDQRSLVLENGQTHVARGQPILKYAAELLAVARDLR